ncbi:MAG: FG-GAP-like repeat-containing protein [Patescibacteria group bacterium]|jgi:hypothetical protein
MNKPILNTIISGVFLFTFSFIPFMTQAGEDVTPPEITAFEISPTEVDTYNNDQTLTITITVADSQSGFDPIAPYFDEDPNNDSLLSIHYAAAISTQTVDFYDIERISGDQYESTYRLTGVMPEWSKAGLWLAWGAISDRIGNSYYFDAADLNEWFPDSNLIVANTTDSSSLTIDKEWQFASDSINPEVTVTFPEDTVITRSEGGLFEVYRMLNQTISSEELTAKNRQGIPLLAVKLGIPGLNLNFSKDVAISMFVGEVNARRNLLIQALTEGEDSWANESTCLVDSSGYCNFTVNHASYFSANYAPIESILTGAGPGGGPQLRTFNYRGVTGFTAGFFGFNESFRGGTNVASGDIDGDGMDEIIVGIGSGEEPWVRVYERSGQKITEFLAYDKNIRGGVYVASGDLDGNGRDEIITGVPEGYGPHVRVFDGRNGEVVITAGFFAYDPWVRTGIRVAAGDLNGDGIDEIVTGTGYGAGTHVRTFTGTGEMTFTPGFFVYGKDDRTGIKVAVGDVDGNGKAEIITGSGKTREPEVRMYDRFGNFISSFAPFPSTFKNGIKIGSGDIDGDRKDEIVVGTEQGGGPQVRSFESNGYLMYSFFAYGESFRGGVDVAVGNYGEKTVPSN